MRWSEAKKLVGRKTVASGRTAEMCGGGGVGGGAVIAVAALHLRLGRKIHSTVRRSWSNKIRVLIKWSGSSVFQGHKSRLFKSSD